MRLMGIPVQLNLSSELPTCENESAVGPRRDEEEEEEEEAEEEEEEEEEEDSTEWHSGNNLLNLLLHLPAATTRPDPHPVGEH
ncbi:hypothetical protein EYF80_052163 [Liparis tanakae]|uniref:Uncharacterized protein n=1 Tax=Liparis tanakae TaxID=230148 RepID=A0A4Z2F925_9TELE|nr:hypothetical protein EYF80_052163 [Liparis tanakae]